ncbi:MAG TPA: hypothetical protein VKB56_11935, partial [Terriglobales bacterium]|nr:hypothetical protein [Terriglobales bacterium]
FRLTRAGFYQIRLANGRDQVIGVNPDRRESNLEALPNDIQQLWSGSSGDNVPQSAGAGERKNQPVSLWWYVMLIALAAASAEIAIASGYMGTQREEP